MILVFSPIDRMRIDRLRGFFGGWVIIESKIESPSNGTQRRSAGHRPRPQVKKNIRKQWPGKRDTASSFCPNSMNTSPAVSPLAALGAPHTHERAHPFFALESLKGLLEDSENLNQSDLFTLGGPPKTHASYGQATQPNRGSSAPLRPVLQSPAAHQEPQRADVFRDKFGGFSWRFVAI